MDGPESRGEIKMSPSVLQTSKNSPKLELTDDGNDLARGEVEGKLMAGTKLEDSQGIEPTD